jgi:hypothetical protein
VNEDDAAVTAEGVAVAALEVGAAADVAVCEADGVRASPGRCDPAAEDADAAAAAARAVAAALAIAAVTTADAAAAVLPTRASGSSATSTASGIGSSTPGGASCTTCPGRVPV